MRLYVQYTDHEFGWFETKRFSSNGETVTFEYAGHWHTLEPNEMKNFVLYSDMGAELTSYFNVWPKLMGG